MSNKKKKSNKSAKHNSNSKNSTLSFIVLAIFIVLKIMTLGSSSSNSGTRTIDMREVNMAKERLEELRIESLRLDMKSEYEYMIEHELFFEDFTKEEQIVKKEFEKLFDSKFKELDSSPVYTLVDLEVSKLALNKLRLGELSVEEIVRDYELYIKEIDINYFMFVDEIERGIVDKKEFFDEMNFIMPSIEYGKFNVYVRKISNSNFVKFESIQDFHVKDSNQVLLEMNELGIDCFIRRASNKIVSIEYTKKIEDKLKEKYGEEFVVKGPYVDPIRGGRNDRYDVCFPKSDIEMEFIVGYTSNYTSDKYLSIVVQREIKKNDGRNIRCS